MADYPLTHSPLAQVLFLVASCGYVRESMMLSTLCRELWNNSSHLMVLTMKELYGPLKESRFILCVKSAKMNDELANRRLLLLQSLKVHDAHLKMVNARGMTALHYACENELLDCIDTLLSWTPTSVVDPNIAGPEGWTPLLQAVLQGKGAVVERLLRYAAVDISRRGVHGKTALVYAASNGRDDIFETLLEEVATRALSPTPSSSSLSPSLLVTDQDAGHSCLEAAQREALREAINDCDDEGKTSLHRACMRNHIGVVNLLLSSKYVDLVDPNKADKYGRTPLISACDNGNTEIVRLLLLPHTSRKASWLNVNKADKFGRTSLLSAVNGAHRSVVDMLLTCPGIDVNHNDNLGWTAIVYAIVGCRNNEAVIQRARRDLRGFILSQRAILRSLLKHPGIDVNKPDKRGTSPLIYACSEARQDIVDLLLQMRKAPPPSPPSPSPSPSPPPPPPPPQPSQFSLLRGSISRLVSAAFGITPRATAQTPAPPPLPPPLWSPDEHMPSDTIFIDVNQSDIKESNCALHVAAEMGLVEICKLLCLQPGVDKNILNGQGLTPLSLAVIQSRLNVVKFMLQEPEIDVNKGEKGTPLMVACIRGNAQIAELLLSLSHCDVHRKSSDGDTALDFLRASAHPDQNLIDLLSQRAARGAAEA